VTELLVKALLSYLAGAVMGSLVLGRLCGGVDIRAHGSGNPGSANAWRTQGKGFGLGVLAIDAGKGWLATACIARAPWLPDTSSDPTWSPWIPVACALAVMLGHIYPVWFGFRGGKSVATLIGAVLGLGPWLLAPMLLTWMATLLGTGFVGLSSILASVALCVSLLLSGEEPRLPLATFGVVSVGVILYTHRGNLARMLSGTEPRARLFRQGR
jgi:glycerol-3-phosphate acyltransferase PlsY